MSKAPSSSGFTLLEVMVATMIMAIAVGGLMTALQTSMRNASRLTDHDRMSLLARSKMDELLAAPGLPLNGHLQGNFDLSQSGGQPAGFMADLSVFDAPPTPRAGTEVLQRVSLAVWWTPGDQRKTLSLEAFRRTAIPRGSQ